ncbi:MAG: PadR family transcriptional regulator [Candidatus Omnitrophica bacterium]|nr:PadR family transcriptional regulator [Candidatus Omnitrophota bacterium]MDD5236377.1 PadR family transcriptional regulator [Candidatus Omnitrophota bacterium]MDD5611394.1 PadR family transcriptional regulator [Candidatus Omnitrophota bacterium]
MIEQRLLFLGLLKESPKHGYEIKKRIKDILSTFAGVEPKSIYYPLRKLEEEGYLDKRITKAGRRPERFVYSLTPKGEAKFKELLNKSLIEFKRPLFNLDLSLYFLPYIKPEFSRRRLKARIQLLNRLIKGLKDFSTLEKQKKTSSYLLSILEHNLFMIQAEVRFLKQLIENL